MSCSPCSPWSTAGRRALSMSCAFCSRLGACKAARKLSGRLCCQRLLNGRLLSRNFKPKSFMRWLLHEAVLSRAAAEDIMESSASDISFERRMLCTPLECRCASSTLAHKIPKIMGCFCRVPDATWAANFICTSDTELRVLLRMCAVKAWTCVAKAGSQAWLVILKAGLTTVLIKSASGGLHLDSLMLKNWLRTKRCKAGRPLSITSFSFSSKPMFIKALPSICSTQILISCKLNSFAVSKRAAMYFTKNRPTILTIFLSSASAQHLSHTGGCPGSITRARLFWHLRWKMTIHPFLMLRKYLCNSWSVMPGNFSVWQKVSQRSISLWSWPSLVPSGRSCKERPLHVGLLDGWSALTSAEGTVWSLASSSSSSGSSPSSPGPLISPRSIIKFFTWVWLWKCCRNHLSRFQVIMSSEHKCQTK